MILCINQELVGGVDNNTRKVVLQADTTAEIATKPTTGFGVDGLEDVCKIYPSSILVCLQDSKTYIFGGDETWHEWTA